MQLANTEKSFDEIRNVWNHYWNGEIIKRPPVVATVWKGQEPRDENPWGSDFGSKKYRYAITGDYETGLKHFEWTLERTRYMAESIPSIGPDLGPDQFAAFFGAELDYSADSPETNWAKPCIDDWDEFLPMTFDENNKAWKGILSYARFLAESARGRYFVSICDLHSNVDALSALRTPQKLCTDFYDSPELVARAMQQVRGYYAHIYDRLYAASGCVSKTGSIGWAPFWSEGRFATIQADFICLVSPAVSRAYIIPALEEEAAFLDHCVYHLDGPGTLPHLDDILAIKNIDVIQWVPGAGQAPMYDWLDLLKKCQKAGKGLQLYDISDLAIVKMIAAELKPEGLVYCISAKDEAQVHEITHWLERNT